MDPQTKVFVLNLSGRKQDTLLLPKDAVRIARLSLLGRKARETALERHTWRQNARRVLGYSSGTRLISNEFSLPTAVAVSLLSSRGTNLAEQNLR
jgi:hypothetical protein